MREMEQNFQLVLKARLRFMPDVTGQHWYAFFFSHIEPFGCRYKNGKE